MTVVAVVFVPIVLAYQSWTYWVFRHRLGREDFDGTPTPIAVLQTSSSAAGTATTRRRAGRERRIVDETGTPAAPRRDAQPTGACCARAAPAARQLALAGALGVAMAVRSSPRRRCWHT